MSATSSGEQTATLLRLATCGSVDDGKSTLIGRLLFDSKAIHEDQLEGVLAASQLKGGEGIDLALLTDGLRAEREQGITIDVAYRYFATERRSFILADTPGHVQYTRNMVTGASTAHVALVLIDARHGVVEQTRRHLFVAGLLGVPHVVVCVNKMDLVGYDRAVFDGIAADVHALAHGHESIDAVIPMSALDGDNVVDPSDRFPWYDGPPLLRLLEEIEVDDEPDTAGTRLPVQYVIRDGDVRHYAGRLAGGTLRDNLTLGLPSPSDSQLLHAAAMTGLDQVIQKHPKGLELEISEGGRGLSGGQRQLVGLTRLLLMQPRLMLLDEPTASMDAQLESQVMKHLFEELPRDAALVVVTHKPGLLVHVNRIVVIDQGRVVIDGPRDQVLARLRGQAPMQAAAHVEAVA